MHPNPKRAGVRILKKAAGIFGALCPPGSDAEVKVDGNGNETLHE